MTVQPTVVLFLIITAGIIWLSRHSLHDVRSHGFYRFFAWEAILILLLINFRYWFDNPLCGRQLFSWLLLIASGLLVFYGVILLRRVGRPAGKRDDKELIGIEKTTELVTVGIYKYIRHPMYSSLLFLSWGAFLKHVSLPSAALALVSTVFLTLTAWREEIENIAYFGEAYESYIKRTHRFIPFIF